MFADYREIWRRYNPAIESAHRRRYAERLKQHAQAAGWPAADNRKKDSACVQLCHSSLGAGGQYLVISHQCAVDIRNNGRTFEWRWARMTHDDCPASLPPTHRQ